MKNLTTAIYSKISGSAFSTAIGGRFYKGTAPDNAVYPYVVFLVVANSPEKTFSEDFENTILQFSVYSKASGSTEIENIYTALKALYNDKCSLNITGATLMWMRRTNATLLIEDHTTKDGTQKVWAYYVTYDIKTSLS